MTEVIGAASIELTIEQQKLKQSAEAAAATLGGELKRSENLAKAGMQRIQGHINALNATKARQSMFELGQAVEKMGGVAALEAGQVDRLRQKIEALAAAGAKVPKNLVLPKLPAGGGLSAGLGAGLQSAAGGLAPGGALGAGLSAIGPAGLAAAAGIGAVTLATKAAYDAFASLAKQAEAWTNTAAATGLGVVQVQQLQAYMEDAGFEADDLQKGMNKLQTEIATGGDSLAKFGIDIREFKGLAPEEQLQKMAQAIIAIVDPTERAAAATEAFGKGGAKQLAAIAGIANGTYKAFGSLSEGAVAELQKVDDELDAAGRAWTNWKNSALVALLRVAEQINKNADPANIGKATQPGGGEATSGELAAGDKANRAAMLADAQKEIASEMARRAKAASLARRKKDEDEAPERARKALAAAEAYEREIERLAEAERRATIDANKRWADEEKAIDRVNEAVKKRISDAQVSIFGTSKAAATEAAFQFGILQVAIERAGQSIQTMSESDLVNYEAELVRLEKASRNDAEANDAIATALGKVRAQLRELDGAKGFEGVKAPVTDVVKKTVDWYQQLQSISQLIQSFPGGLGKAGGALAGLTAGGAGIGAGLKDFKAAGAIGGLSGILGKLGAAGQIASAAVGIGSAIVGLFKSDPVKKAQKEAGQALGYGISRELAQTLLDQAKATGKSIAQVAKEYQAKINAEQKAANLETLRTGVSTAQQGAESLLSLMDKLAPKAQAAGGALVRAVADAMAANGLGVMATGELAKSEQFSAVQQAVGAGGQIFQGLRQAGGISTDLLANGGAFTEALKQQAVEAAKAAGLSDAEAQKAGIAVVAPLLRDQLNASIESGQKLSAQTQALLDEAKANGIEIVADPLLEQLAVQKSMDASLKAIAGGRGAVGPSGLKTPGGSSGRPTVSAAGGFRGITGDVGGGLGPLFQSHPGEMVSIIPRELVSQLGPRGDSARLGGGLNLSQSTGDVNVRIDGGGSNAGQLRDMVTAAVKDALRLVGGTANAELVQFLDKRYGFGRP